MRTYICNQTQVGEMVQKFIDNGCTIFEITNVPNSGTYMIQYM